eukprot:5403288-Pleurochrysis_carterae.AAC.2
MSPLRVACAADETQGSGDVASFSQAHAHPSNSRSPLRTAAQSCHFCVRGVGRPRLALVEILLGDEPVDANRLLLLQPQVAITHRVVGPPRQLERDPAPLEAVRLRRDAHSDAARARAYGVWGLDA